MSEVVYNCKVFSVLKAAPQAFHFLKKWNAYLRWF